MQRFYPFYFIFLLSFGLCIANESPAPKSPLEAPELSTLVNLIKAAGLEDIFVGTGPFTVFAPTNEAFDKLGKKKLEDFLKTENKDHLADVLTYHLIPGKYLSSSLKPMEAKTINGKSIQIKIENSQIKVNNATVLKKDMVGPNGVVYEIDTVLLPAN